MKAKEIEHIWASVCSIGSGRIGSTTDAERPGGLTSLGKTADGIEVELNARAVSSDLIIYVNLTFVSMNGGYKSLGTGLVGYRTLKGHHNPGTIRETECYMEPARSTLAKKMEGVGKLIEEKLNVFHIETTVNNRMFDKPLAFLAKNEDELSRAEERAMSASSRL